MTSREWLPQQAAFEFVRRGYSPEQVHEHLDRLEYDLRIITADRDSASHRLTELTAQASAAQSEADELRSQLDREALSPTSMAGLSDRMQRMIRLAEEEASEIRARAQAEAADRQANMDRLSADLGEQRRSFEAEREKARGQLAQQVRDLIAEANNEGERIRTEAATKAAAIIGSAQDEVNRLHAEGQHRIGYATDTAETIAAEGVAERNRLDSEAAARRKGIEDDFTIAITARRNQAHQYVADQEHESHQQAVELVTTATAEAGKRIADATAEADRLVTAATDEAQRRVAFAAAEAHRRVTAANAAVTSLVALRDDVLGQLTGLAPYLDQIHAATSAAQELVAGLPAEPSRPTGDDFDPDVDPLVFSGAAGFSEEGIPDDWAADDADDQTRSPNLTSANISGAVSK